MSSLHNDNRMMKKKPGLTFVCSNLAGGGAERVMSILIRYFHQKEYSLQLILLNDERIAYDVPDSMEIRCLNWKNLDNPLYFLFRTIELRRSIKGDVVIPFLFAPVCFSVCASMFSRKRVIASERNNPYSDPPGRIRKRLRNISYELADAVVFQTEDAKRYFSAAVREKGVVIPNPIQGELDIKGKQEREHRIVSVCRLYPQKNIPMAIDAFAEFSKEYPEYIFEIYGDGPLEQELSDYIAGKSLQEKVFLKGFSHTVHADIVDAMMYVSSSDYEGISNSMLEAMAIGLPVICTDCPAGGARQTITNGYNGMLIPVGDAAALHRAMCKIAGDKEYRDRIAKHAAQIRETCKAENICREWEKLIHTVSGLHT